MKILVCGGRDYQNSKRVTDILGKVDSEKGVDLIITGGATGADALAGEWADRNTVPRCEFPANWDHLGKRAGPLRNGLMLEFMQPDAVIAFGGGKGTGNMVSQAKGSGVPVWEIDRE